MTYPHLIIFPTVHLPTNILENIPHQIMYCTIRNDVEMFTTFRCHGIGF